MRLGTVILDFRLLGPVEVLADGVPRPVTRRQERAVLALLLLEAHAVVPVDRLIDALWADRPPSRPDDVLRTYVSRLRQVMAASPHQLVAARRGYRLVVEPGAIDVRRFDELAAQGHRHLAAGSPAAARSSFAAAQAQWRGPVLADLRDFAAFEIPVARLAEARLATTEGLFEAMIACGQHQSAVVELEPWARLHPLRERNWELLMLALYRAGRQADALQAYREIRSTLASELGVKPGTALHRLETLILRQDPSLDAIPTSDRGDERVAELARDWASGGAAAHVGPSALRSAQEAWEAGRRAVAHRAHESAVGHFRKALMDTGRSEAPAAHCDLLIELGDAQRRAGEPDHRHSLLEAGRAAIRLGDGERAARAAVSNSRGYYSRYFEVDHERVEILQATLALIGPFGNAQTCARLLAELASELQFSGDVRRAEFALAALRLARESGDDTTLAHALAAHWFASWGLAPPRERSELATELVALARDLPDHEVALAAAVADFLSALEVGQLPRARRALADCAKRADEMGQPAAAWRVAYLSTNLALATGHWEKIPELSDRNERLAAGLNLPEGVVFARTPTLVAYLLQGRFREAAAVASSLLECTPNSLSMRLALTWALAELGESVQARRLLGELRGTGVLKLARNYLWLPHAVMLGAACARLGDGEGAAALYRELLPHAEYVATSQTVCLGPVGYYLGLLAARLGELDAAVDHLDQAARLLSTSGLRATTFQTPLTLAQVLLRRGRPPDATIADALLNETIAEARRHGLVELEYTARASQTR